MTATAQALVPVSPYVRREGDTVELLRLVRITEGTHVGEYAVEVIAGDDVEGDFKSLHLVDGDAVNGNVKWVVVDAAPADVVDEFLAWDTGDSWEAYEDVVDEYVTTAADL